MMAHLLEPPPEVREHEPLGLRELPEEDQPGGVAQPGGAPAGLPEGDGRVGGGEPQAVHGPRLPEPLVRLGEGDVVRLLPQVAKPSIEQELLLQLAPAPPLLPPLALGPLLGGDQAEGGEGGGAQLVPSRLGKSQALA